MTLVNCLKIEIIMPNLTYSSKKSLLIAMLPIVVTMNGCTINAEPEIDELSAAQINDSIVQWNAMQPDVKRLIAKEQELTELKELLLKLTQAPVMNKEEEVVMHEEAPVNLMSEKDNELHQQQSLSAVKSNADLVASKNSKIAPNDVGAAAVQIGAFGSRADLELATKQFYNRFNGLTQTTAAYSEPVVLGKALFRLKIGPFKTRKIAKNQCDALKKAQLDCMPSKLKANSMLVNY